MTRNSKLLIGAAASVGVAALFHWPLGAAATLEADVERAARAELDRNEMTQVQARLKERPLSRTLVLSGPADDFQRSELIRVLGEIPGVAAVEWDPDSLPQEGRTR